MNADAAIPASNTAVSRSGVRSELLQVAEMLQRAGILSEESVREIENRGAMAAARLQAARVDRREPSPFETLGALEVKDVRTGEILVTEAIAEAVAAQLGMPFERIDPLKLDAEFSTKLYSKPFAMRHLMIPLREEDGEIVVALGRPLDIDSQELARKSVSRPVRFVSALPHEVERVITEFYGFRRSVKSAQRQLIGPSVDLQNFEQLVRVRGDSELEASDQHIINAVDYMFRYAFELNASDIHIEPRREESRIRYRIDGVMHRVYSIPKNVHAALVSRVKMLSRMDIAEKRRPQDGRIKTVHQDRQVEMRVSAMPVAMGEKIVIRLFDPATVHGDLARLGFREDELALFRRWITQPHGVVLVTGPTGSGKSTTLYTALQNVASDEINIITVEDPIEMMFDNLNQVAVQPQVGITFAAALRTILRQDPDVIMVGEIRDADTASYAIQAALTGHMVFSTLHTNDAPTAIPRLIDLGVEPFLLAGALTGCMAQRLVRRVCDKCAVEELVPRADLVALGGDDTGDDMVAIPRPEGCPDCRGTGYRGRLAIVEMMEMNEALRAEVHGNADVDVLRKLARQNGMRTLRQTGISLVREGLTTIDEVIRVTSDFTG